MRSEELFIILLVATVVIVVPLIAIVLSIVAISRARRVQDLQARVTSLEMYVRRAVSAQQNQIRDASTPISESVPRPEEIHSASVKDEQSLAKARAAEFNAAESTAVQPLAASVADRSSVQESEPIGWETFIGQKAFGWVAVLLFFLATTFFLRYAYQNNWIGPIGRVAIGGI